MYFVRQASTTQLPTFSFYSYFALVLLLGNTITVAAQSRLRVGIIGDQTYSSNPDASYQILERGIEILSNENVACVLHTGDLLESSASSEKYRAQFAKATGLLDKLGKPWHLAPGDHDINPVPYWQDSTDRSKEELYRELYGQREPGLTHTLNHSFDISGYHFIALNSQEHLHADPRWGDVFLNRFTNEQYNWLKNDLTKHRKAKGIVVFLHQPMWYNWGGWVSVHQLLRQYPVIAVIAGHFHYDQDDGELDGIRYIVVGATGGMIKNASRNAGNVHHVTVMSLMGRKAEFRLIPVDGSGPLQLTPRAVMDRVQAIDSLLGGLSCFVKDFPCPKDKQNFVCVKDGKLQGRSGQAPGISLVRIGNPIDVPVSVRITLADNKLLLINPHYLSSACQQVSADGSCVLAPAARIESSNTSSVALDETYSGPLATLWESELALRGGNNVEVGDTIELLVRISFRSSAGDVFVENKATIPISTCPE